MTTLVDRLSQKVLEVPLGDRVRLAEKLLSIAHLGEAEVDAAWDLEMQGRLAEINDCTASLIPAEGAFRAVSAILV